MPDFNSDKILAATQKWLEDVVIGLDLCPFAKPVYIKKQIRFQVSLATTAEDLLRDLILELKFLENKENLNIETTLLIHPRALEIFLDYNDFLEVADAALVELNLEGEIQIASFHPQYQFEGTGVDDIENYTNRSPYPMLHLLRESSIEQAIASYPDVEGIPDSNIKRLRELSVSEKKKLIKN